MISDAIELIEEDLNNDLNPDTGDESADEKDKMQYYSLLKTPPLLPPKKEYEEDYIIAKYKWNI